MGNLIISYEKSNKGVPVLIVAKEGMELFSLKNSNTIINTFVGTEATELYEKLTKKESK